MLTRRRKAAVVLQLLISAGQKITLTGLPQDLQLALTRELAALRKVDRGTLMTIAQEFLAELDGLAISDAGGMEGVLDALGDQISPEALAQLRREAGKTEPEDPWRGLAALEPADLVAPLQAEAVEVCAIAMAKLPVSKAAAVLALMPGERARRIAYAISRVAKVPPERVNLIGQCLAETFGVGAAPVFGHPPDQRLGAILNSSSAATREDVLEGLGQTDAAFAEQVRRAIFTFLDIPARLAQGDVPRALRAVDEADLVTALAAAFAMPATAPVAEFLLAGLSKRMAEQLRDGIAEKGKVRPADGEAAQGAVVAAIRELADTREITLNTPEDDASADAG
ncbi:MAG: flagellar motor switch protein FliG [Limimaricola sp.]|uniref:FliG C-terminal domain-containing protein n=1 Tax=Limimaricola sp. TaxID=2211665 RepID=UPI001E0CC304|nr:FliG C-terminal domain-containing protein [Limimaricola sp.]MBI1416648.1 flagellar motor switch protein FliG [Limimaricola sp.]